MKKKKNILKIKESEKTQCILHSKIMIFFRTARVSNRIVETNTQLLVNNDYEHASISMVGKGKMFVYVGIIAVCYLSSLMNLIIDGGGSVRRKKKAIDS